MIPPVLTAGTKSPGEPVVFEALVDSTETKDWTVFHSLDFGPTRKSRGGEADFVIVAPDIGVLVVEVKGCRSLRRSGGAWYYGNDPIPDTRGPFKQAADAMHNLRRKLVKEFPDLRSVPFSWQVVFPFFAFSERSIEWEEWQHLDINAFRGDSFPSALRRAAERSRGSSGGRLVEGADGRLISSASEEVLVRRLRSDFEVYQSPRARVAELEEELRRYTAEQFLYLDAVSSNARVLLSGPAGTGKTLMALEVARRAAAEGQRVLLLCYNRSLAAWIRTQLPDDTSIEARTIHAYMVNCSSIKPTSAHAANSTFWERDLPEAAAAQLMDDSNPPQYDSLVIDELQDVLTEEYLDVLELSLAGGLASGNWRFFGDLENQSLYLRPTADELLGMLESRVSRFVQLSLSQNCRNTPRIVSHVELLCGVDGAYGGVLRPDDGVDPRLVVYGSSEAQVALLCEVLETLYQDGFRGEDIVILSRFGDSNCVAGKVCVEPWRNRIVPAHCNPGRGLVRYSSIKAFKGLEALAVVITDVSGLDGDEETSLLYTGMTRACQRLYVLLHESARGEVLKASLGSRRTAIETKEGGA